MVKYALVVVLAGCAAEQVGDLPVEAAGPPLAWMGLGVSALDRGETVVLEARDVAPGDTVVFLRGDGMGPGPCPPALAGACAQIVQPVVVGRAVADASGLARLTFRMPQAGVGREVGFQAVVPGVALSEAQERYVRPNGTLDPYVVGVHDPLPDQTFIQLAGVLTATIDLTEPVTVTGFTCEGEAIGGWFKGALYTDVAGVPQTLVASSFQATVSPGTNRSANVMAPAVLPPGRYWLANAFESRVYLTENLAQADSPGWLRLQPFNTPWAPTWVGGVYAPGPRWSCGVEVQ